MPLTLLSFIDSDSTWVTLSADVVRANTTHPGTSSWYPLKSHHVENTLVIPAHVSSI